MPILHINEWLGRGCKRILPINKSRGRGSMHIPPINDSLRRESTMSGRLPTVEAFGWPFCLATAESALSKTVIFLECVPNVLLLLILLFFFLLVCWESVRTIMRRISQASLSIVGRMQAPRNYYKSTKKIDAEKMLCKRRDGYTNAREREREILINKRKWNL